MGDLFCLIQTTHSQLQEHSMSRAAGVEDEEPRSSDADGGLIIGSTGSGASFCKPLLLVLESSGN